MSFCVFKVNLTNLTLNTQNDIRSISKAGGCRKRDQVVECLQWFFSSMNHFMVSWVVWFSEASVASVTLKWLFASVSSFMSFQITWWHKTFATRWALKFPSTYVKLLVFCQFMLFLECFLTHFTLKSLVHFNFFWILSCEVVWVVCLKNCVKSHVLEWK